MPPDAARGSRRDTLFPWFVLAASLFILIMTQGAVFMLTVSLKPIAETFDWPRQVPSLAYALASFGAGIGAIYLAQLSERIGMGPVALGGATMVGLGCIVASYTEQPWHLYAAFGLMVGLFGNAALFSPLMANITRWFDKNRGLAIGVVGSGQSIAGMMWSPIVRWVNENEGWRTTFFWYGIVTLCVAIPLTAVLRRKAPGPAPGSGPDPLAHADGRVLGWPSAVVLGVLCAAIFGCCIAMAMPITHLVAYASDLGHPTARAAELLSVLLGASMLSRLGCGLLADRIGGLTTLFICASGQALMLAVMAFTVELPSLYIVVALFGLVYGGIVPTYAYIVREYFPLAGSARRISTIFFFGLTSMATGSWIGGFVFDLAGDYRAAFLIGVAANMVNIVLVGTLLYRAYMRPPSPSPVAA